MTQAVLLGQADLAADYKKHPRMSPKGRIELADETRQQKSEDRRKMSVVEPPRISSEPGSWKNEMMP